MTYPAAALFGGKKNDADAAGGDGDAKVAMTTEDALAKAKALVNDMNDAATGTVTSYQPGREKVPTTCNEIMAKSVVVANEEKAAVMAEKDAVVKAATLLSEKNDDLTSQLNVARLELTTLEKAVAESTSECDAKFEAQKAEMMAEKSELEQKIADLKAAHELEMNNVWDGAKLMKEKAQEALDEAKEQNEAKLKEVMDEAAQIKQEAEQKIQAEEERSKLKMDKLRNATAATVAKIEKETADKLAASEKEVADKLEEARQEVLTAKANAQDEIMKSQQAADEKVASITAKAEQQQAFIREDANKRINNAKAEAQHVVDKKQKEMADREETLQHEMAKLKEAHAAKIKEVETLLDQKVQQVHARMEEAIIKANGKLNAEKKKYAELEERLEKEESEAQNLQSTLQNDLKLQRSESFKLEKVSV